MSNEPPQPDALLPAAERLRLIEENVRDYAILTMDAQRNILSWSAGAEDLFGYTASEALGRRADLVFMPEDRENGIPDQEMRRALEAGRAEDERWHRRKHGERFWGSGVLTALRDEQGALKGFVKILRDFTARRQAEQDRRRAEAALEATLRSIGDAVIATDAEGRITLMNTVAEQLTGWTEADAASRPCVDIFHIVNEHSGREVESPVERVLREGVVVGLANHTILIARDGARRPIDDSGAPIVDEAGALTGVVLVFRDVTERRETEHALERQAQLIELAYDCIFTHDVDNRITYWNRSCEELYGWTRSEALGSVAYELLKTRFPESREATMETLLSSGRWEGEIVHTTRDGNEIIVFSRWALQRDDEGHPLSVLEITRDITERVRAEQRLRRHQGEIETLNERLRRAMTETHHRVKNNLQIIAAMIDLLTMDDQEALPTAEVKRLGSHITTLAVVHDLLTQEAKSGGHADSVSARSVLEKLAPLIERSVRGRHIQTQLEDLELSSRQATSLALVANELISNALKYGEGDVQVRFRASGNTGTMVVEDKGPGFPPDFNPAAAETTGIGLVTSLTRWDLGGTVEFANRPEGGASVTVTLESIREGA